MSEPVSPETYARFKSLHERRTQLSDEVRELERRKADLCRRIEQIDKEIYDLITDE